MQPLSYRLVVESEPHGVALAGFEIEVTTNDSGEVVLRGTVQDQGQLIALIDRVLALNVVLVYLEVSGAA